MIGYRSRQKRVNYKIVQCRKYDLCEPYGILCVMEEVPWFALFKMLKVKIRFEGKTRLKRFLRQVGRSSI